MAELPLARLFFPSGERSGERLDATLTVLTMPGLVLPPRNVPRDHWSTSEQLAVPLLHLASWYATRAVYGRSMSSRKLVALDETHFLGEWSAGRALFTRLGAGLAEVEHLRARGLPEPVRRARDGRRELHVGRVRGPDRGRRRRT